MYIKEYRIPLPLSVDEYRIAQLYMIQKKSRMETTGTGSGVEIIENRPYVNGPGGQGQYTKKIYHIGSHLPSWLKALLPKTALRVEEEAWNAYPYTKTITTCPFVEKFFIDIETFYISDTGNRDNIFGLANEDRQSIHTDIIDPVKDNFPSNYYKKEEDPRYFVSSKTGRGPLSDLWLMESRESGAEPVMCAYKLIKVEFKYWGMQSKIEHFIHDGIRNAMLVGHRQAWSWQDEWWGLKIEDIRRLEEEAQAELANKMTNAFNPASPDRNGNQEQQISDENATNDSRMQDQVPKSSDFNIGRLSGISNSSKYLYGRNSSRKSLDRKSIATCTSPEELLIGLRMNAIQQSESEDDLSDEEEAFFDALETLEDTKETISTPEKRRPLQRGDGSFSLERWPFSSASSEACSSSENTPKTNSTLLLVVHGGSIIDLGPEDDDKQADFVTFKTCIENMMGSMYPDAPLVLRLVKCPNVCSSIIEMMHDIFVCNEEKGTGVENIWLPSHFPASCVPLLLYSSHEFPAAVAAVVREANSVYNKFLDLLNGQEFQGQVCILADSIGSMLVQEALCSFLETRSTSSDSLRTVDSNATDCTNDGDSQISSREPLVRNQTEIMPEQSSPSKTSNKFNFQVGDFFCAGSPIGMIILKQALENSNGLPIRPNCNQVFNLFHPFDPASARLEPLLDKAFSNFQPAEVPRFQTFPFSDDILYGTPRAVQHSFEDLVSTVIPDSPSERLLGIGKIERKVSCTESCSSAGSYSRLNSLRLLDVETYWWGSKRIDYMLHCPDGLQNFPVSALTELCYNSYWESKDMAAFILWQLFDEGSGNYTSSIMDAKMSFEPQRPKEKWLKKRTALKIKNLSPSHRANDIILCEGKVQSFSGKFSYGPVDVAALTGEKVDVYVASFKQPGDWKLVGSGLSDNHGRFMHVVPAGEDLPLGVHCVRMVVRGDQSYVDCNCAIIPRGTKSVVFSIDGSFLANYSMSGKDPKLRGGAVDVVRYWQELGYLIIYVTSRLLFQKTQVMAWLSQHNFPFGMVFFCESISKDLQKHKLEFLRSIVTKENVIIHAAYGSSRDIPVYSTIGLSPQQVFIVSKSKHKKHTNSAQIIRDGYTCHISDLISHPLSRPVSTFSFLPQTSFGVQACFNKFGKEKIKGKTKFKFCERKKKPSQDQVQDDRRELTDSASSSRLIRTLMHKSTKSKK